MAARNALLVRLESVRRFNDGSLIASAVFANGETVVDVRVPAAAGIGTREQLAAYLLGLPAEQRSRSASYLTGMVEIEEPVAAPVAADPAPAEAAPAAEAAQADAPDAPGASEATQAAPTTAKATRSK